MVDVNSEKFKACVKIVISQTDYDEEKATEKLIEFNEDFIKVISISKVNTNKRVHLIVEALLHCKKNIEWNATFTFATC